ncbi:hypothetical protein BDZ91DRAFT_744849 [Kalaharituber pfeilii]|nr:hypothetical protein BDZ91DRAFT_744849 [Kalaharituber pfeilii]
MTVSHWSRYSWECQSMLTALLGITFKANNAWCQTYRLKSKIMRTVELCQHEAVWGALIDKKGPYRREVMEVVKAHRGRLFFVIGVKIARDAEVEVGREESSGKRGGLEVNVGMGTGVRVSEGGEFRLVGSGKGSREGWEERTERINGDRAFAVEYREVKVKLKMEVGRKSGYTKGKGKQRMCEHDKVDDAHSTVDARPRYRSHSARSLLEDEGKQAVQQMEGSDGLRKENSPLGHGISYVWGLQRAVEEQAKELEELKRKQEEIIRSLSGDQFHYQTPHDLQPLQNHSPRINDVIYDSGITRATNASPQAYALAPFTRERYELDSKKELKDLSALTFSFNAYMASPAIPASLSLSDTDFRLNCASPSPGPVRRARTAREVDNAYSYYGRSWRQGRSGSRYRSRSLDGRERSQSLGERGQSQSLDGRERSRSPGGRERSRLLERREGRDPMDRTDWRYHSLRRDWRDRRDWSDWKGQRNRWQDPERERERDATLTPGVTQRRESRRGLDRQCGNANSRSRRNVRMDVNYVLNPLEAKTSEEQSASVGGGVGELPPHCSDKRNAYEAFESEQGEEDFELELGDEVYVQELDSLW